MANNKVLSYGFVFKYSMVYISQDKHSRPWKIKIKHIKSLLLLYNLIFYGDETLFCMDKTAYFTVNPQFNSFIFNLNKRQA